MHLTHNGKKIPIFKHNKCTHTIFMSIEIVNIERLSTLNSYQ